MRRGPATHVRSLAANPVGRHDVEQGRLAIYGGTVIGPIEETASCVSTSPLGSLKPSHPHTRPVTQNPRAPAWTVLEQNPRLSTGIGDTHVGGAPGPAVKRNPPTAPRSERPLTEVSGRLRTLELARSGSSSNPDCQDCGLEQTLARGSVVTVPRAGA